MIQIRVEPQLAGFIEQAVRRTGLTRSEVLRQALRKGIPAVVKTLERRSRRTLVDALLDLKGLELPRRRHRM